MILKGNQRGGGQQLAAHLLNSFQNERIEVADVRGSVAQDLSGAFAEWTAQASCTRAKKNLYSLSLSPDPAQGRMTHEQYMELIGRVERSLKLVNQPRAVVFHEKRGDDGVLREHCHAVWSRIDTEKMKAVQISHDRLKLRTVTRDFCRDFGLELPEGMKPGNRKDRFNDVAKQQNLGERQQQERSGIPKEVIMADMATCWRETGNGAAFVQALEAKGYWLARGDQRAYVIIDLHGEVHSLSRHLSGVAKSKELKDRLSGYPLDKLSSVEAVRADIGKRREQAAQQVTQDSRQSEIEKHIAALKEHQAARRAEIDRQRIDLIARHMNERDGLKAMHEAANTGVVSARLARQPKGLLAFIARITGLKMMTDVRQRQQDQRRAGQQKEQADTLQRRHERELKGMDRHYRALARLEARENRSAETDRQREEFRIHVIERKPPARELKPEFDRAAQQVWQRTGTDDGRAASPAARPDFEKAAKPPLDLVEAFNREVENRTRREDIDRDRDSGPDLSFDPKDPKR